jgi:hypothetical protein
MTARGLRINNPGNVRHSDKNKWQGMSVVQPDAAFVAFTSPEYGIRAIARILLQYQKRGIDTVGEIIRAYAPPEENDTDAYVKNVCRWCGVLPDDVLDIDDFDVMLPLVKAIVRQETGAKYPDSTYTNALRMAGIVGVVPKPLAQSRTIQGSAVATGGGAVALVAEVSRQVQEVQTAIEPALSAWTWLQQYGVFIALTAVVAAGAWIAYARWQDRKRLGH